MGLVCAITGDGLKSSKADDSKISNKKGKALTAEESRELIRVVKEDLRQKIDVIMAITEDMVPLTNLHTVLPADLEMNPASAVKELTSKALELLKTAGYDSVAERYADLAEDTKSIYALIIVTATYMKVTREVD